jgi:phosphoglycerate dehydrogenase-like enzyme
MYSNYAPSHEHLARLEAMVGDGKVHVAHDTESAIAFAKTSEIVFGHRYLRQILPVADRLRWVQTTAGGVDQLPWQELRERCILLTRNTLNSQAIAHHSVALAWALIRRLPETFSAQTQRIWAPPPAMLPIPRTAMVLGLGSVGLNTVKLLRGLGLRVLGTSLSGTDTQRQACDQYVSHHAWRNHLHEVDLLVLAMPYTELTHKCVGKTELAALPAHAVLVNIARAGLLDMEALISALNAGKLGGAALDVMDPLPEPTDNVWETSNLLLTPKVSAYHPQMQAAFENFAEAQLERYLAGEPLLHRA